MAATGSRVLQAVKPHIRMIKFPDRSAMAQTVAAGSVDPLVSMSSVPSPPQNATSKPIGSTPRGSGISEKDMPAKYRRKPLTDEEMEYIFRGGPE